MKSKSITGGLDRRKNGASKAAKTQKLSTDPWRTYAGIWRDHPDFDEFLKEIKAARRETAEAERTMPQ